MQYSLSIFSDSSDVLQSHRNGRLLGYAITTRAVRHAWVSCLQDIADCLIPGETVYIRWTAVVATTLSADEECKQEGKWAPRLASMQACAVHMHAAGDKDAVSRKARKACFVLHESM